MKAEIIAIGTEMLLGHIVNTNAAFLSQRLAELGVDVYYQTTVGDNPDRLSGAIRQGLRRSDIVITTGGLGPTVDDITAETVAKLADRELVPDRAVLKDLGGYFKTKGKIVPQGAKRQAYVPEGAIVIRNKVGAAPGLVITCDGRVLICLPGPPRELEPMFTGAVIAYLRKRLESHSVLKSRAIRLAGIPESRVNVKVKDLLGLKPPATVGIYAKLGEVQLKIMSKAGTKKEADRAISAIEKKIRARLGGYIFGCDGETLESAAGTVLAKKQKTIAVAESCTGGLISDRITNVSGSSKFFIGGIVAYDNRIKENILCVLEDSLKRYGAVSRQVASEMALGVKYLFGADVGLAVTGIAGPTGGTRAKPMGLVYIALVAGNKQIVKECRFTGLRQEIKFQASQAALDLIRKSV